MMDGPPLGRLHPDEVDLDLLALPSPSRTRGLTGAALMVTVMLLSIGLGVMYLGDLRYFALGNRVPRELGAADELSVGTLAENEYVTIDGMPLASRAVRFRRLGHAGIYRVYPIAGQARVFVERFTPEGTPTGRAKAQGQYTGRMVRMSRAGAAYKSVRRYLEQQMGTPVPADAWLLVDGEAPGDRAWILGLYGMLAVFLGFNGFVLWRHSRPIRD